VEAARYAGGELGAARNRLASAETAVGERKMILADQFADESRAEAELASAKTAEAKASEVNDEMKRSTRTFNRTLVATAVAAALITACASAPMKPAGSAEVRGKLTRLQGDANLGDVLFTTGKGGLKSAAAGNLNRLVAFLGQYPNRTVLIEGYTDNTGSADYNQGLSQRRAHGVKAYLAGQGVGIVRLTSALHRANATLPFQ
jgi:outer membrane protein OmpA-like peptidoglycan-associated protein